MKPTFYPSAYRRWGTCTASPVAIASSEVDNERSQYADDGVFAHEIHALCLSLDLDPYSFVGKPLTVKNLGEKVIEMSMVDAVNDSINYVLDRTEGRELFIEHKVDLSWIAPEIGKGIMDVGVIIDDGKDVTIKIMDYKNGKGVREDAQKHPELMLHATGLLYNREMLPLQQFERVKNIELHIMQPNINHFDCYVTSKAEVASFVNEVQQKYREAKDPKLAKFTPSVAGCRFCPIKTKCKPLAESVYAKAFGDPTGISRELRNPSELTNDELAELYPWLEFISAWTGNVKEHMQKQAAKGTKYHGLKVIEGAPGHRKWKDEDQAAEHMAEKLEEFEIYERCLISPSKYEKQVGKKNVGEFFKTLVIQDKGAPRLVTEDTPGRLLTEAGIDEFND